MTLGAVADILAAFARTSFRGRLKTAAVMTTRSNDWAGTGVVMAFCVVAEKFAAFDRARVSGYLHTVAV